jgi:Tol biopolymer transport system component
MNDTRDILRRGVGDFEPGPDGYERVIGRLERKRRNQRIMARTLAVVVMLIGSLAFLAVLRSDRPADEGPPSPGLFPLGKIAFPQFDPVSRRQQIMVIQPDGSGLVQLTSGDVDSDWPAWSPDGSKIAFVRQNMLFTMNADGSEQTFVQGLIDRRFMYQPSWSPDGSQLVFGAGHTAGYEIYVVNVDGSDLTKISGGHMQDFWPSWSPDGSLIAFRAGAERHLATMRPDGSDRTTVISRAIDYPTWSADGQIQFVSRSQAGADVFRINPDGTGLRQLTDSHEAEYFPVASADGTQIAYRSPVVGPGSAIFVLSIGSATPVRVAHVTSTEAPLSWQTTEGAPR